MHQPIAEHTTNAQELRALILEAMRVHATIQPRGHDTTRLRTSLHNQIDDMLDDYALEILVDNPQAQHHTA